MPTIARRASAAWNGKRLSLSPGLPPALSIRKFPQAPGHAIASPPDYAFTIT
jgi:hypothetical protein